MLNPARSAHGTALQWLFSSTRVFIDRMHFKNHVDPWCQAHMDPDAVDGMGNVNTEVGSTRPALQSVQHLESPITMPVANLLALQTCEQLFSWLSGFKAAVRHMNEARFIFFIAHLCHLHNCGLEKRLQADGLLRQSGTMADISRPPAYEFKAPITPSPLFQKAQKVGQNVMIGMVKTMHPCCKKNSGFLAFSTASAL
jgi:hypothetical protein